MKNPFIPISWGELFDKITILQIKSEKILSPTFGGDERSLSVKSGLLALAKLKEPPEKVYLLHQL